MHRRSLAGRYPSETFSRDPEPFQPEMICGSGVSEGYLPEKTFDASGYGIGNGRANHLSFEASCVIDRSETVAAKDGGAKPTQGCIHGVSPNGQ